MTCEKCGSTDTVKAVADATYNDGSIVRGIMCRECQHLWGIRIEMVDRVDGGICITRGCSRRVVEDHMISVGVGKVICAECIEQLMTVGFTRN